MPGNLNFDVHFSAKISNSPDNLSVANVKVTPDTIVVQSISQPLGRTDVLRLTVADPIKEGVEVKVVFDKIEYPNGNQTATAAKLAPLGA